MSNARVDIGEWALYVVYKYIDGQISPDVLPN